MCLDAARYNIYLIKVLTERLSILPKRKHRKNKFSRLKRLFLFIFTSPSAQKYGKVNANHPTVTYFVENNKTGFKADLSSYKPPPYLF